MDLYMFIFLLLVPGYRRPPLYPYQKDVEVNKEREG